MEKPSLVSAPRYFITPFDHTTARGGVRSASLRLTARNLGLWSNFKSWDPEIATQGNDAAVYNFVQLTPPRIWTVRMTLGF